jgi:hypothetical protein
MRVARLHSSSSTRVSQPPEERQSHGAPLTRRPHWGAAAAEATRAALTRSFRGRGRPPSSQPRLRLASFCPAGVSGRPDISRGGNKTVSQPRRMNYARSAPMRQP